MANNALLGGVAEIRSNNVNRAGVQPSQNDILVLRAAEG
jgi:hypothetical protein